VASSTKADGPAAACFGALGDNLLSRPFRLGFVVLAGIVLELVLWFYIVLLLARIVAEWVQMFARAWQPGGAILVLLELIYSATDPPIKLFRRFVPPLRLGGQGIDLSILLVLLICIVVREVNRHTLLFA
jgi:YggT family protein